MRKHFLRVRSTHPCQDPLTPTHTQMQTHPHIPAHTNNLMHYTVTKICFNFYASHSMVLRFQAVMNSEDIETMEDGEDEILATIDNSAAALTWHRVREEVAKDT